MVNKHCCYGTCESDSRCKNKPHMRDGFFSLTVQSQKSLGQMYTGVHWICMCGRPPEQLNVEEITGWIFAAIVLLVALPCKFPGSVDKLNYVSHLHVHNILIIYCCKIKTC